MASKLKYAILLSLMWMAKENVAQNIKAVQMDEIVKLIDSSSTPLVINFWASWCVPCIQEIPYFEKQVGLNSQKKVKLILVSLDFKEDFPQKLDRFVSDNRFKSQVLWLSETDADSFCPKIDPKWEGAIPATLFVNREKNYRHFVGTQMTEAGFREQLLKAL